MATATRLSNAFRIEDGRQFRLKDVDPADTGPFESREDATDLLDHGVARLSELQEKLYAQDRPEGGIRWRESIRSRRRT